MELIAVPMASSGGSGFTLLLPLILIVGMIWFMSRTQRKQRQRQADTVSALTPGTKVITTSGMVGIVEEVDDDYVTVEVSDGVLVQFVKNAVGKVIPDDSTDEHETSSPATTNTATSTAAEPAGEVAEMPEPDANGKVQDKPKLPPTHSEN